MKTKELRIRNVPEELWKALKIAAVNNDKSLQDHILEILERSIKRG